MIYIIFHFILAVNKLISFKFPHVFRKFGAVNILFVAKVSYVVFEAIFR